MSKTAVSSRLRPTPSKFGVDGTKSFDWTTRRNERVTVTPELAERWLKFYEDGSGTVYNRTPGVTHVIKMARDMANDHWKDTGVPIIFGTHGKVLDGGQRLQAVVMSDKPIEFNVEFGVDPAAQIAMDRVRARTFANDLQMKGVVNYMVIAATTNIILHWRSGKLLDKRDAPTPTELLEFEQQHSEELQLAGRQAGYVYGRLPLVTKTVIAAVFFEAVKIDEDTCMTFFEGLAEGKDLPDGDPILALRNVILRYRRGFKPSRTEQLYQCVYAWNLFRAGRQISHIRVPKTLTSESFPRMK
jgi:hypothetical protein